MSLRKTIVLLALSALTGLVAAGESRPFSQQEFDRLNHDGKPVVLDVTASWCPTCKAQKPIIEALSKQPAYKDVTLLAVDFDADKATLKQFKVGMQSTLVAFRGGKEVARSVGDTTPAGIESLFKKAAN